MDCMKRAYVTVKKLHGLHEKSIYDSKEAVG